jgi:magnesium transporter
VTWINVAGLHEVKIIEKIGELFELHPLLLEDTLNTEHRPKFEDFGAWILIVLKMLYFDQEHGGIKAEQVSLVMGSGFVISFQEGEADLFDPVRERGLSLLCSDRCDR